MPRKKQKMAEIGLKSGEMVIIPKAPKGATKISGKAIPLTKERIFFAALDAAKRNMRNNCRTTLNDEDDDDVFFEVYDRLFEFIGGVEGWINLPDK